MKKKFDLLGILLAGIMGIALITAVLIRTFAPRIILPSLDLPAMVLISVAALAIEYYIPLESRRDFRFVPIFGAVVFGVFPLAALAVSPLDALINALIGCAVLTASTFIFDSMTDRISSGDSKVAKIAAPAVSAIGLYLAAQCLMGII